MYKKQQIEQIYCAHFIKLMNFDVRYEHFEQQAETAAQKWQKGMYIKKIKKRYPKENHFPHDIAIEFQEQSDHAESNRDFSHFPSC